MKVTCNTADLHLCPQCRQRYFAILAMYGVKDQQVGPRTAMLLTACLRTLCIFAKSQETTS